MRIPNTILDNNEKFAKFILNLDEQSFKQYFLEEKGADVHEHLELLSRFLQKVSKSYFGTKVVEHLIKILDEESLINFFYSSHYASQFFVDYQNHPAIMTLINKISSQGLSTLCNMGRVNASPTTWLFASENKLPALAVIENLDSKDLSAIIEKEAYNVLGYFKFEGHPALFQTLIAKLGSQHFSKIIQKVCNVNLTTYVTMITNLEDELFQVFVNGLNFKLLAETFLELNKLYAIKNDRVFLITALKRRIASLAPHLLSSEIPSILTQDFIPLLNILDQDTSLTFISKLDCKMEFNSQLTTDNWFYFGESLIICASGGADYVKASKGIEQRIKSPLAENCHRIRRKGLECSIRGLLTISEEKDGGGREAFLGYLGLEVESEDKSALRAYLNGRSASPQQNEVQGLDEDNSETNPIQSTLDELEKRAKRVEEAKGWNAFSQALISYITHINQAKKTQSPAFVDNMLTYKFSYEMAVGMAAPQKAQEAVTKMEQCISKEYKLVKDQNSHLLAKLSQLQQQISQVYPLATTNEDVKATPSQEETKEDKMNLHFNNHNVNNTLFFTNPTTSFVTLENKEHWNPETNQERGPLLLDIKQSDIEWQEKSTVGDNRPREIKKDIEDLLLDIARDTAKWKKTAPDSKSRIETVLFKLGTKILELDKRYQTCCWMISSTRNNLHLKRNSLVYLYCQIKKQLTNKDRVLAQKLSIELLRNSRENEQANHFCYTLFGVHNSSLFSSKTETDTVKVLRESTNYLRCGSYSN